MGLSDWGVLGKLEYARQVLIERYPLGFTRRELEEETGVPDSGWSTFVMQLTRYCYVYEEQTGKEIRYYVDPDRDDVFERRILPYDRLERDFRLDSGERNQSEDGFGFDDGRYQDHSDR
jgi:hypothetical protein